MNNLKKQVLLNCFITPMTLIPVLIGGTLLLFSEMLGPMLAIAGFLACVFGIGVVAVNMIFNLERITQQTIKYQQVSKQIQREQELDSLHTRLLYTPWTDDEEALRNLRGVYNALCQGNSEDIPVSLLNQVDEIFNACIVRLTKSCELHVQSHNMSGKPKQKLLAQRAQMVRDVEASVERLGEVIAEINDMKWRGSQGDLSSLQRKLQTQLDVAMAMENLNLPTEERYREYQA